MTSDEVIEALGLGPLPEEGGQWVQTWRDETQSSIYFLLRPGDFSALHRLTVAELWHFYAGAPIEMLLLEADGTVAEPRLGPALERGDRPFLGVPAGVWMGAETTGDWSLVGTTMAPPFEPGHFELGARDTLSERYPGAAQRIERLTRVPE